CAGTIAEINVEAGETYAVGAILGYINSAAPVEPSMDMPLAPGTTPTPSAAATTLPQPSHLPLSAPTKTGSLISPRLRARLDETGLHPSELGIMAGTGHAGRVTVQDFEKYLEMFRGLASQKCSSLRLGVADSMRRSWSRPLAT